MHIPYSGGAQGRTFHHGRFVQNLCAHARAAPGVDLVEATVTDLFKCPFMCSVASICTRREDANQKESSCADLVQLVVIADSCMCIYPYGRVWVHGPTPTNSSFPVLVMRVGGQCESILI
jgi:hypothetical protein